MSLEHSPQRGVRDSRASVPAAAGVDSQSDEWMRPQQAAAYIKSTTSTLAKKRLKGNGPTYTKFGRMVLYAKRDLDEFLASRRRSSTSDTGGES